MIDVLGSNNDLKGVASLVQYLPCLRRAKAPNVSRGKNLDTKL